MLTMHELMRDPVFRAYMKRVPPAVPNPHPAWQIWVNVTGTPRWMTRVYPTYQAVWPVFVERHRAGGYDCTITSRRTFYAPPGEWYKVKVRRSTPTAAGGTHYIEERWRQTFTWDTMDAHAEWCGRCRRPVRFEPLFETHHALRRWPVVSDEDNMRCPICGIRRSAQPALEQMVRL